MISNNKQSIVLYHGSDKLIKEPIFHGGKKNNDFGYGFYCTCDQELAKEWAVSSLKDGFCNEYLFDVDNMKVLNLNTSKYTILNWIAVLVEHRIFSIKNPVTNRAKKYLIDNYSINVDAYDVIIGYRADDSYFDYAQTFLNNGITVEQLAKAMRLGKLGEQIVLKSKIAFANIKFKDFESVSKEEYYIKRKTRNDETNRYYFDILNEESDGLYIQDIIRKGIKNDDTRIPRNISK